MRKSEAFKQAKKMADKAGVTVRSFRSTGELQAAAELFAAIWETPAREQPVAAHMMRALELTGNYVSGAFDGMGELVGASVGFCAIGQPRELHSHITGVQRGRHSGGIGFAMKLHQRAWALDLGIEIITWTFDPLIRRNAVFNLSKLGATAKSYINNAYGEMSDALNAGDESDRLWVEWKLESARAKAAAAGVPYVVADESPLPLCLDVGPDGRPVAFDNEDGGRYRIRVPSDVEAMRAEDPALASEWRMAVREAFSDPDLLGGEIEGLSDEGDFVLSPGHGWIRPRLHLVEDE